MTIDDRQAASSGALTLTCPECGTVMTTQPGRRLATDFCTTCDYPMFWARGSHAAEPAPIHDGDSDRRSPGVHGTRQAARVACPSCQEPNLPEARTCVRCLASMLVEPAPPPIPVPAPQPVVVVTKEVRCDHPSLWLVVLLTSTITMLATIALVVIVTRLS